MEEDELENLHCWQSFFVKNVGRIFIIDDNGLFNLGFRDKIKKIMILKEI